MFADIKGQERPIELFRNSVSRDRLAQAYLFLGPQGLGKTLATMLQVGPHVGVPERPQREGSVVPILAVLHGTYFR